MNDEKDLGKYLEMKEWKELEEHGMKSSLWLTVVSDGTLLWKSYASLRSNRIYITLHTMELDS